MYPTLLLDNGAPLIWNMPTADDYNDKLQHMAILKSVLNDRRKEEESDGRDAYSRRRLASSKGISTNTNKVG
jgi:hypothetical protein